MSIAVPLYGFGASGGGSGGTLTVTAPANVTVTVSKDGKTKTKNSGTSGVVVFKGLASGTWTLTITDGSQTSSKPVVVTADYSTVIAFLQPPSTSPILPVRPALALTAQRLYPPLIPVVHGLASYRMPELGLQPLQMG